jgi:hypothetical protein
MVTVYPTEYANTHDIIDKSFFTGGEIDAKKERDDLARKLRKEGYKVETKKCSFDTKDGYFLHAVKDARPQTINLNILLQEFKTLKSEIFGNESFVVVQDMEKEKRYNQLLGLFNPDFRYAGWINPLEGMKRI